MNNTTPQQKSTRWGKIKTWLREHIVETEENEKKNPMSWKYIFSILGIDDAMKSPKMKPRYDRTLQGSLNLQKDLAKCNKPGEMTETL